MYIPYLSFFSYPAVEQRRRQASVYVALMLAIFSSSLSFALAAPKLSPCLKESTVIPNYVEKLDDYHVSHQSALDCIDAYQRSVHQLSMTLEGCCLLFADSEYCHQSSKGGGCSALLRHLLADTQADVKQHTEPQVTQLKRSHSLLFLARTLSASLLAN